MPYLKLIFGFFLLAFALIAFLFSPITAKISEAHSIYCGVPPEPFYVLDNFNQQHTGPIPHHPATVTTTVSGTTVTVSWSPSTGCYGWYEQPAGVTTLPASSWHYTSATSASFVGSCGFTYQPSVITIMNGDLVFAGYCCNIDHGSNWNHSAATTDVNFNNSVSTVGNSVTVTCAPPMSATATPIACSGGAAQPVNLSWSNPPSGTQSYFYYRDTNPSFTPPPPSSGCFPGSTTSTTDNPPAPGTYYYRVYAINGPGCGGNASFADTGPVTVAACFDYGLTNNGNITASQGSSGSNVITANLTVAPTQSVSFSASGLPSGATPSFSPLSCNPTCSSTLTISTSGSTPLGTFPITVTGSPLSRTTSFNLIVTGPPGSFTATATPSCSGTTSRITLTGSSSGAASYTISRSPTRAGLPTTITSPSLSYVDDIVTAGTGYTYTVTANNGSGSTLAGGLASPVTALNCANPTVNLRVGNADYASASEGPIAITSGSSSLLTWVSSNATSCNATGAWATTGSKPLKNTTSSTQSTGTLVSPGPYTSTLSCTNGNIPTSPSNPAADFVTISIIAPLPWIQTTGGDVHSDTKIDTPGGP